MIRQVFVLLSLGLLATAGAAAGFPRSFEEHAALRESLDHVSRKQWASWLERHGYDASRYAIYQRPETSGLSLVGKWGRGPSVEVMAQDTLMALTLGSECALLSIANPDEPRVLSEIQLDYLPRQSLICDTLLFTGGNGIQIWNVANPVQPARISEIPYAVADFSIVDTFLYFVGSDTFFAYSFANPANPQRIGFCVDSGYVTSATRNTVILILPNDVLGFVDVSDPAHPQQVGIWPAWPLTAAARGNLCCAAFADPSNQFRSWFLTLDISDPANPRQLARLDTLCGYDICLTDSLAFVSGRSDGYEGMRIVNIADSTNPRKLGTCDVWNDNWGVWADLSHNRAYIASEPSGLAVVSIADLNVPHVDTCVMAADQAVDIWIDGDRAYVADYRAGLKILDISSPSSPRELGGSDSVHTFCETAVASDSFAFASWPQPPLFRSFLVSDPTRPQLVGGFDPETDPKDMVIRDTLVYLAGRFRFNVVNVARPRDPVLVGNCNISGTGVDLLLQDTLAYVSSLPTQIVNVVNPTSPTVIGTFPTYGNGLAVRDSIAFAPALYDSMVIYSVRNPSAPVRIGRYTFSGGHVWNAGVALVGTLLYVGGDLLHVLDVSDPLDPTEVTAWRPPYDARRLAHDTRYLYAACYEAGICILETIPTGITERFEKGGEGGRFSVSPSITLGPVVVRADSMVRQAALRLYNATGIFIGESRAQVSRDGTGLCWSLDLSSLADGVYFVSVCGANRSFTTKVVKTKRR